MRLRSIKNPPTEGKIKLDDALRVTRAVAKQPVEPKPVRDWKLVVDRRRPEPVQRQLANQLGFLIRNGLATEGSALFGERELANSLKVSRNVVRGAYTELLLKGKIETNKKGFVVVRSSTEQEQDSAAQSTKPKRYLKRFGSKRTARSNKTTKSGIA